MKIPYGNADFADIRRQGMFYVDKTPFLAELENAEFGYKSVVFLRPRRMGKSSLISMMAHYYDVTRADQFDELFGGLWVHEHPTPEKNAHVVLHLNFGKVTGHDEAALRRSFFDCVRRSVDAMLPRYTNRFDRLRRFAEEMANLNEPTEVLDRLIGVVGGLNLRLYVMIDEYDTFANSLISVGNKELYMALTEKTGFVRTFYRALKAGVDTGGIARIFVTGVAPLLLDDLYTGFNIATNISLKRRFNHLAGFRHVDVELALDELLRDKPELTKDPSIGDRQVLLDVLTQHYDGYRFSEDAPERVFNSDMVLYFLQQLNDHGRYPSDMLDMNVRTDYKKFYGLFQAANKSIDERREVIDSVLIEGKVGGRLLQTFGTAPVARPREQFISLLYYTGMLTIAAEPRTGWMTYFEVPNRVIWNMQWEHFEAMMIEETGIELGTPAILAGQLKMAQLGELKAYLQVIHEEIMKVLGVKDFMRFDEKSVKMIFITSAVISNVFHVLSEREFAQGYCDLFMSPKHDVPAGNYSWLIELKYLPTNASEERIAKALEEAEEQVKRYSGDKDLMPMLTKNHELRAASVVFVGSKEIRCRPWPKKVDDEFRILAKVAAKKKKTPSRRVMGKTTPKKKPLYS
ncbi:MAG TPA: AAA family ATPase [Polyangium sp.]|nr:AAA family ATPase [Polyangium sp.]